MRLLLGTVLILATTAAASAQSGSGLKVVASDQAVSNGIVSADRVMAEKNGWLVIHRTDAEMKPGPVVGHAPIRAGETSDVAAILTEDVAAGDMLMLMVHSEDGGTQRGVFEYTLGAKEDGPVRVNDKLVMTTITAQ